MAVPVVDEAKCTGCKQCAEDFCREDVFEMQGDKSVVVCPEACLGCRACEMCPEGAIHVEG